MAVLPVLFEDPKIYLETEIIYEIEKIASEHVFVL